MSVCVLSFSLLPLSLKCLTLINSRSSVFFFNLPYLINLCLASHFFLKSDTFRFYIWKWSILTWFLYLVKYGSKFYFFTCGYPTNPVLFIEKLVLSSLNCLCDLCHPCAGLFLNSLLCSIGLFSCCHLCCRLMICFKIQ